METKQPFKALSRICLNNWHYIDRKVLTLSEGINFFTGHSGSGKSTVIDALQIVLYASTDGRGFFNKAAADDSDRTLIEYLRGMVNISENNEAQYLRNQNFSSTIVLELEQTNTKEKQCVGVVFDVDTSTNDVNRLFFWHTGELLKEYYRIGKRCLSSLELREYLQRTFSPERFYCGSSNERFRRQLYDIYLGGLDMEKFPRLFKRAIPFRMNIKLEEFVKEYICMEMDIHIEDLQESVMQYGRMRGKIEETVEEIRRLLQIQECYQDYDEKRNGAKMCAYQIERLEMLRLEALEQECRDKIESRRGDITAGERQKEGLEEEQRAIQGEYEEVILRIANSGYSGLKAEREALEAELLRLENSKDRWRQTAERLKKWRDEDITPNQVLWDIDKFAECDISEEELERLMESLKDLQDDLEEQRQETDADLRRIKKEEREARDELKALKQGKKAYPREFEEARFELRNRLHECCGKFVNVQILADLLEIKDERWQNAVEGYMGNNKLLLIVEPAYAKIAMDIYQEMDKKKFFRASVLDTEKVTSEAHPARNGSLAEEVRAKEPYVQAYINFFLGNVMKCETVRELRNSKIGITPDCVLYHSFRLQHIHPENYTRCAYIGEVSMRQRIRRLEEQCQRLQEERLPLQEQLEGIRQKMQLERLSQPIGDYLGWLTDIQEIEGKARQRDQIAEKMERLKSESVDAWESEKQKLNEKQDAKKSQVVKVQETIWNYQKEIEKLHEELLQAEAGIMEQRQKLGQKMQNVDRYEQEFHKYLAGRKSVNYDYLKRQRLSDLYPMREAEEAAYQKLVEERSGYVRTYPNRTFSTAIRDNRPYDELLENLRCDELEAFRESAKEQAQSAVEHFKDDFIFKIRSAIREAYQRKDELNRIISGLDFGKDKYQFVITKNKGADGRYYKMFMDDALQIHPSQLTDSMENQLDMFTMEHENQYKEMMNELINVFIPPENATQEELNEAKKNMDKYADYRTYLSFDMQQIIKGQKDMAIGLGRMIKKNSGGEGQNPLYVALLASFAQVYKINTPARFQRNPTIRLVVLDEAFSKMDAEKVASCISLIRGLGFQAIISATNDKIQNYLENVDKTFVYANPDKRHISIQEFERKDFGELEE
ncbi:chromosome segregation protein SMC [Lachnospiraceae bacterium WCA-9-b2]|uniref:Chromosome segregation protein SMC n=1 Tax=Sporofaciens musculi TaxID=2681861 RepID=A0A7X3MLU5_9FIRM|nr:SbcC/MukB-like Walker B domain-containing protein [Sporofaciens musculi]MXP78786.1 chromosome segregation protein SMC [Sporofaciens musculi]